ncbi:MAG: TonB-dependent receptor plug domain-containing protein [Saprospiraceae bacterium]|nr:TonB-dependent receptor plug domain-containing protein [Saprospiraceae bacterium]
MLKRLSNKKVLYDIEAQTAAKFVFSNNAIKDVRKVSLNVQSEQLSSVLEKLLTPLSISYEVTGQRIVLKRKETRTGVFEAVEPLNTEGVVAPKMVYATVKGVVRDASNELLIGASVQLENSNKGTLTDEKGEFSLVIDDNEASGNLVVTFVGYDKLIVPIYLNAPMVITLSEAGALSEVVVVGYGEKSKKKVTTSISSVKGDLVNELPVGTAGDALAAAAAGVQVSSGFGGMPGESPTIRIRGIGSLGADNAPLYVVDGYPLQSEANFASINPADIESIEVLKDAASAAIYGSRAANGVIIVTTKRGKDTKTRFNASFITGSQAITKKVDVLNREEFNEYIPLLRGIKYKVLDSLQRYEGTDWQDQIFRNTSYQEAKLSAAGGSEKAKFVFSAGYLNQPGVLLGTGAKRYTLRINFDGELTPQLKTGVSLAPSYVEQDRRPNGGNFNTSSDGEYGVVVPSPIYTALLISPAIPLQLPDGRFAQPNF